MNEVKGAEILWVPEIKFMANVPDLPPFEREALSFELRATRQIVQWLT